MPSLGVGHGFASVLAGIGSRDGWSVEGKMGVNPTDWLSVFGFGKASQSSGFEAGVGAEAKF